MRSKRILLGTIALFTTLYTHSQFTEKESTRKSKITTERAWWDLKKYEISLNVHAESKSLTGTNMVHFEALENGKVLQIDLQPPMRIKSVLGQGQELGYQKKGAAHLIRLAKPLKKGETDSVLIAFEGSPPVAKRPPWDGGWIWAKDKNGKDFISHANQSLGASSWLPCKDHPYDEPDQGVDIKVRVKPGSVAVSNGRLENTVKGQDGHTTYHWKVRNPINSYGINVNIGDYVHFGEKYSGEKGELTCDYYVLRDNLDKARKQFLQAPMTLEAMEHWFGPYPFYEDGYKLVEVPYLGMEHQSSVTYGNQYENGYLGGDLSQTGWGLKFDFIIIHESAHEWFANSITNNDVADMWIHEGFTTYAEVLYLDYHFGTEAGNAYLVGMRERILNDKPIIGAYGKDDSGSVDKYVKGAAMIHTLRQVIDDDVKFRDLLRKINLEFYHRTISSEQMENLIMQQTGLDLKGFFDQYLRTVKIPVFEYKVSANQLRYRYRNLSGDFELPLKIYLDGEAHWIRPNKQWQQLSHPTEIGTLEVDKNFYLKVSD